MEKERVPPKLASVFHFLLLSSPAGRFGLAWTTLPQFNFFTFLSDCVHIGSILFVFTKTLTTRLSDIPLHKRNRNRCISVTSGMLNSVNRFILRFHGSSILLFLLVSIILLPSITYLYTKGVTKGVIDGVTEGVTEGVGVIEGVTDGVSF